MATMRPPAPQLERRERIVDVRGAKMGLAEYGAADGSPVICLHGAPASRLMYAVADEAAARLGLRLIAPDRPGYGLSPADHRTTGLAAQARLVEGLAGVLGLERFALIGISGGGPYATATAALVGNRCTALALVSPVGLIAELGTSPWLAAGHRWFFTELPRQRLSFPLLARVARSIFRAAPGMTVSMAGLLLGPPDRVTLARPEARRAVIDMTLEALRAGVGGGLADMDVYGAPWDCDLSRISAPARLWQGTDDVIVPVAASIELSRRIPGCRLTMIEGGGHFWVLDHAGEVLAALARMIDAPQITPPGS